ncbi:MAG: phosphotransferase [Alphaproteobacteria bacterium]|nr:phosphotransferase [Alphaproteobacteria bacterium]
MLTAEEIARLADYLAQTLQTGPVRVENLSRIPGGASRETYRFDAVTEDIAGGVRGFILRRDPPDSLIDTERALEFAAYKSFFGRGVPVPEAIALVADDSVLERPFFIMERIDHGASSSPFQPDPFGAHRESIGREFFSILGAIAAVDPYDTEMPGVVDTPAPEDCWRRELDHWQKVVEDDSLEPQPIAMAAIRRLRRNPPHPPPKLAVVHGDYRVGNFLHDGAGRITAVLDWEMAHIGDPMEDLAWALDPLWASDPTRAAGLLDFEEAIRHWQQASGRRFNAEAFQWWSLFSSLKGLAIWISSSKAYHDGKNTDPILAFSGWYCATRHNKIIADRLSQTTWGGL